MNDWLPGIVTALAVLAGTGLTGFVTYRIANRERDARNHEELRAALIAYGTALDRLGFQVDQLPHAAGPVASWQIRQLARWRDLDWVVGRISVATVGRGLMRAIDNMHGPSNRLTLVAPKPVLESARAIGELIERFEQGDAQWKAEWQEARNALTRASREALDAQ